MQIDRRTMTVVATALLIAGGAAGYLVGISGTVSEVRSPHDFKVSAGKGDDSELMNLLRERIAELERKLADASGDGKIVITNVISEANRPQAPWRHGNPREWLEELRKSNPQRHAEMTNRFARFQRQRAERARATLEFLSSIDDSVLGSSARSSHQALMDLVVKREEIMSRLHQEGITDDERRQCMESLRDSHREFVRLNQEERRNLMEAAVSSLGFDGDDKKEIVTAFEDIVRSTDVGFGGHGGPGGPPEGPGGPARGAPQRP